MNIEVICNNSRKGYYLSRYCQSKCTHADFHLLNEDCHEDECIYTGLKCKCERCNLI